MTKNTCCAFGGAFACRCSFLDTLSSSRLLGGMSLQEPLERAGLGQEVVPSGEMRQLSGLTNLLPLQAGCMKKKTNTSHAWASQPG